MKKTLVTLLAAALLLALLTGAAVAATMLWGVEDFAARRGETLPDVPVQQAIPQSGGVGSEVTVTATSALWDGENVHITLHCQPHADQLLLMEACLSPDMTANNLDPRLPRSCTIAGWAAASGYTDALGLCIAPLISGRYMPCRVAWHLEDAAATPCTTSSTAWQTAPSTSAFSVAPGGGMKPAAASAAMTAMKPSTSSAPSIRP